MSQDCEWGLWERVWELTGIKMWMKEIPIFQEISGTFRAAAVHRDFFVFSGTCPIS